jgi:hypothetical protein
MVLDDEVALSEKTGEFFDTLFFEVVVGW